MYAVHDEEKSFELEMAWISEESNRLFQQVPATIVADAEQKAKEAKEAADM